MKRDQLEKKFNPRKQAATDQDENGGAVLSGIVAPAPVEWEGVPVGVGEMIDGAIYDFCNFSCDPPITDLSKERQTRWTAACMYIGRAVFKKYKLIYSKNPDGGGLSVDGDKVNAFIPVWLDYCGKFNKAPFEHAFFYFVGLEWLVIYNDAAEIESKYGYGVTTLRAKVRQNLKDLEKGGLKDKITDGYGNPTGAIAILNNEHGYSRGAQTITVETKSALTAAALPVLGGFSTDNGGLLETSGD